jgi:glycosyltransferase involved in cell wall biosynthesis
MKSPARVVMLLSNPATNDLRPLKEGHALAAAGNEVTILAWDRELETKSDSRFPDGLVIKRMRVHAGHGTPVLTIPRLFLFYLWCAVHLVGSSFDAVHCHDVDTLPVGFAAKVLSIPRAKLVYDMHDLPEAFLRFFPLTRLTQGVFIALAKKKADIVVVVNEKFVDYLARLGFRKERLVVVMNAPPAKEGRKRKRSSVGFSALYYGWLGEERGVKLLIDAVEPLQDVSLVIAGRGELEQQVREAAARNPRIQFKGWLKVKDLEPLMWEADLIPSLYLPRTRNAQLATPGKLLSSMSLSLPSLVPSGSYQADIVERLGCGLVVNSYSADEVREAIARLSTDSTLYDRLAEAAYRGFLGSFSWEVMASRLVSTYARLTGKPGAQTGAGA